MIFWILVGIATAATLVLALPLRWLRRRSIERPARFWRNTLLLHVMLAAVHAFATVPLFMGYFGSRYVGTRHDERTYAGPLVQGNEWTLQNRHSLERDGPRDGSAFRVALRSRDGVALRAFHVPALGEPRLCVVLVHGLFRGAVEVESVASMFRRSGAATLLLELRNHGGSGRAPFTGGRDEALDVVAGAAYLAEQHPELPLAVFGVSLGTAAVAMAAPQIEGLDGIFLDAPMDDLTQTAERFMAVRSFLRIPDPFRSLIFESLQAWSGFEFREVSPARALASLPIDVEVQLVAEGKDEMMPLESVQRIYDALRQPEGRRDLWVCEAATHGRAWLEDGKGYEAVVAAFADRVVAAR